MSYHECPIEPPDWSDGPDYLNDGNCCECDGTGLTVDERTEEDVDCPECGGTGWVDEPRFDDDVM